MVTLTAQASWRMLTQQSVVMSLVSLLTSSSSKLDFISLKVSLALDNFDETLRGSRECC